MDRHKCEWLPAVLAAVAFVAFAVALLSELFTYQELAIGWANGDINSRAHLAAANLVEPLRTQDFRTIQRIGEACERDGVHLKVTSSRGGVVFDSRPRSSQDLPFYSERYPSGEYWVVIGMPHERVVAPFKRAIRGFLLSGLVGIAGVILFFFITYRQRVHIRELKRLEKFRREFIADVSHEIKTPLTGILGAVEMLEAEEKKVGSEGRVPQESLLISLIGKESVRLNGLVQSILDLARLEREGERVNRVETDIAELVRELCVRHGIRPPSPSAPVVISIDSQLVSQAVENLMVNAIRHSGTADISASVTSDAHSVSVIVEDHGIGIPPEHAALIFERFHRVDPARAAETGGAGLGLAIVRRVARLHGGEATYAPANPRGSRFELKFPRVF